MAKKTTVYEFIEKAREVHEGKYLYCVDFSLPLVIKCTLSVNSRRISGLLHSITLTSNL